MLFDNQKDPLQLTNLIDSPDHAALRKELHETMLALLKKADDPFDSKPIQKLWLERKALARPRKKKG